MPKNKVALISPSQKHIYGHPPPYPPLSLMQISSVLKQDNYKTIFIEQDFYSPGEFQKTISDPDIICIFITSTSPLMVEVKKLIEKIKLFSSAPVFLGGPHAMAVGRAALIPGLDYLFTGEGENQVLPIVNCLTGKESLRDIPGLISREFSNPPDELITDLDSLPLPDYSLAQPWNRYQPPEAKNLPAVPVMFSRGCRGNCCFCSTPRFWGRNPRRMSPYRAVELIEKVITEQNAKEIHIADDDLTGDRRWMEQFCYLIRLKNFPVKFLFLNGLRAQNIDQDMLIQTKYANFENVGFGVESGNQEIYRKIGKNIPFSQLNRAIHLSHKFGMVTWGFYIFGLPGENRFTATQTIQHAIKHEISVAKFFILQPYPGTPIHDLYENLGYLKSPPVYSLYDQPVIELPQLTLDELISIRRQAYLKFYFNIKKILGFIKIINKFSLRTLVSSAGFVARRMLS